MDSGKMNERAKVKELRGSKIDTLNYFDEDSA